MRFITAIFLTALLGFAIPLYLSWWTFVASSFFIAVVIRQTPIKSFAAGFLGLLLLWGIYAFALDNANQHELATKVAYILPLHGSVAALIVITAVVGGLVSGFAALTGSYLHKQ